MKTKWQPQEKQIQALKSNADEILFGGARGGGKTDTGMVWLLYDISNPQYRALVIRRNYTDLNDWIDRAKEMYSGTGARFTGDKFTFPSGAIIRTGHLADKDAYQKYQGHEYHKILIEELTHISRVQDYEKLLASNRSTTDIKPQVFCTTNPDGAGHEWVKDRWNIPDRPTDKVETSLNNRNLLFVPSSVHDNKYIGDDYISYLESLQDEELRRAWLEGSWEGFGVEGSYYKKQLQQAEKDGRLGIANLYDNYAQVYTWCDLGIRDSFAIVYAQFTSNDIRVIDYDEFEGESLQEAITRMRNKPYVYADHYAPHDIQVRELGTGKSRLDTAMGLGINYNVVPQGSVADRIDASRMKLAKCYFDQKADLLVTRLKRYHKEFDEKRGVYKNKPVHDINSHGADAFGYMAITKVNMYDYRQEAEILYNRNKSKRMI